MCVGRYAEKMQWSEAKWNLFEPLARSNLFGQMPAIDMSVLCIPAECDNIKLPIECEIASRWDAYLLCDICRHFASVMLHFASLISHNLRCIPAYTHQIPTGFFSIVPKECMSLVEGRLWSKLLMLPRPTVSDARHYIRTCLQAALASELAWS